MLDSKSAADLYLQWVKASGNSEATYERYKRVCDLFVENVPQVDRDTLLNYLIKYQESHSQNNYSMLTKVIRIWFRCMSEISDGEQDEWWKLVRIIPKVRTHEVTIKLPPYGEFEKIIACAMQGKEAWRDACVILLMSDLGLRAAEVRGLTWDNVDMKELVIHVKGKGGDTTVMPLLASNRLFNAISLRYKNSYLRQLSRRPELPPPHYVASAVFQHRLHYRSLTKLLERLAAESGGQYIRPHLWRYYFCHRLLDMDMSSTHIQYWMRHKSLTQTEGYINRVGVSAQRLLNFIPRHRECTISNGLSMESGRAAHIPLPEEDMNIQVS